MDSNDARRSKVPAGTFRSSSRPRAGEDAAAPAAAPPPPSTDASARPPKPPVPAGATPTRRVGTSTAAPPTPAPPAEVDGRAKFTSTLVGVTPSKAPPQAAAPVLAPPPWRGASAYHDGQEPQPRVSSISSPGVAPSVLADGTVAHPDDRRVPHTRVTAAAPPAPSQEVGKPSAATAEIGDAIQQLLDAQTAVSMEGVQETGSGATGTLRGQHGVASDTLRGQQSQGLLRDSVLEPVRESQIEVVRDSAIEAEQSPEPVRSLPPAASVAKRSKIDQTQRTLVEPSAVPEPRPAAPSARWSAPVARPIAPEPPMSDRELAAYSFVERDERDQRDASFAPAEVRSAAAPADDSNVRLGIWVAAAMVIVGVGGWIATRGGFDIPPRTPAAAPVIAAPPTAVAPLSAPAKPAASPELGDVEPAPRPVPEQAATTAAPGATAPRAAPSTPQGPAPVGTPVAPRSPRPPRTAGEAEASPAASEAARTVLPSAEAPPAPARAAATPAVPAGPMPQTPTRENVQSALDEKRSEVLACANGQHGVAEVDLTVASSGAVTHAVVAGDFAGTAAGSCIARVVRTARFAPFSKPRFRVIYPFSL